MKPDFKKSPDGLVPVIVQDAYTSKVLMLGYMNEEALQKTTSEGRVTFYSRSKKRLWTKGEESGNYIASKEILIDCDNDTILIKGKPSGPVCHTGADTCFNEVNKESSFLNKLEDIIEDRKKNPTAESHVSRLFSRGINKIAQKLGEEAVELVIEAKDNDNNLFKNEAADLLFHFLILLNAKGYRLNDIEKVLEERNKAKK